MVDDIVKVQTGSCTLTSMSLYREAIQIWALLVEAAIFYTLARSLSARHSGTYVPIEAIKHVKQLYSCQTSDHLAQPISTDNRVRACFRKAPRAPLFEMLATIEPTFRIRQST